MSSTDVPRGMRLLVKGWGSFSGVCCAALGFFVLFTLSATCFGVGLYMIILGGLVIAFEAPICCQNFSWLMKCSEWIDNHFRFWMKGTMYFLLAFVPVILCAKVSTFCGGGAVFITAALYGVLAIGKKGGGTTQQDKSEDIEMKASLVDNKGDAEHLESRQ